MVLNNKIKRYLDTNILVYSIDLSKENVEKYRAALEVLRPSKIEVLCLSPQVIAEFYAVPLKTPLLGGVGVGRPEMPVSVKLFD